MFKHQGIAPSQSDFLKIASLHSFVARFVNVVGFINVHVLKTNDTGYFTFFADDIYNLKINERFTLYFFFFFIDAFVFG